MIRSTALGLVTAMLVLAVAGSLRFGAVQDSVVVDPLRADAREYFLYAYNLRQHGVYSDSDRALYDPAASLAPAAGRSPGYPLFLSLFVDGPPNAAILRQVMLVQAALGVLSVLFALLAFRRWMPLPFAGIAAMLCALSPHLVNSSLYLLTETLFTLMLTLVLWAVDARAMRERPLHALLIGVLIGVANLVRPSLMLFAPLLALLLVLRPARGPGTRGALLLLAAFLAVQTPWVLRNLVNVDEEDAPSVLLATATAGMYPNFMYQDEPATFGYAYRFDPDAELYKRDAGALLGELARRFGSEPLEHLRWYLLVKPIALWSWDIVQGQGGAFVYELSSSPYYEGRVFAWSYRLMHLLHWPLVALAALGALLAWMPSTRRRVSPDAVFGLRVVSALLVYFVVLHVVLAPYPRYSVPLRPALYGLAAFTAWQAWTWLATRVGATRP